MESKERPSSFKLPLTDFVIDKIGGLLKVTERRYPGESVPRQLLKSPDVLALGVALTAVYSVTASIEIPLVLLNKMIRRASTEMRHAIKTKGSRDDRL